MKALYFENKIKEVLALKAASVFDRYAAFKRFSPLKYADIPEPTIPNSRWIKVRNKCCGLCGSDIHFMFMELDPKCFPAALPGVGRVFLGHELLGEVVEVGDDAAGAACIDGVADLAPGDRVVMRMGWPNCFQMEISPPCRQCARGSYMLCENLGERKLPLRDVGGGFSPYMVMHSTQPYKVSADLPEAAAAVIEPFACGVHGALKVKLAAGAKVLVVGAGTIGLTTVAALRALHPEVDVYCLARHPFQARVAEKLGATAVAEGADSYDRVAEITGGRVAKGHLGNRIVLGGFDAIYDSVGNDGTVNSALRWARAGGAVVLLGINFQPGKIDYTPVWNQEVDLLGVNSHADEEEGVTTFAITERLLLEGALDPEDLVTHRFPMSNWQKAVKTFMSKKRSGAIKVMLEHG